MTESLDSRRLELVSAAQKQWIAALTDLGGRNTLLYYKDRRAATLDLTHADPDAMDRFTRTGSIRLTRLFSRRRPARRRDQADAGHPPQGPRAARGARHPGRRTWPLGMARWDELFLEPAAPVLLRGLTITPTRARYDDFELILDDEEEVNPVLVHKLTSVFGAEVTKLTPQNAAARLRQAAAAAEVPGFEITERRVIGTFTYAKLPMVRDMEAAGDLLAESDLVAAIAGDPEAQELVSADTEPPTANRLAGGRLLRPGRRLLPAQRHRHRAGRAEPGHPRAAGHRQEPDHRQPDRRAGRPRPQGAVRGGEARRHRRRAVPAQGRGPG